MFEIIEEFHQAVTITYTDISGDNLSVSVESSIFSVWENVTESYLEKVLPQ